MGLVRGLTVPVDLSAALAGRVPDRADFAAGLVGAVSSKVAPMVLADLAVASSKAAPVAGAEVSAEADSVVGLVVEVGAAVSALAHAGGAVARE